MMRWTFAGRVAGGATLLAVVVLGLSACGDEKPQRAPAPTAPSPQPGQVAGAGAAADEAPAAITDPDDVIVKRFRPTRDPFRSIYENRTRVQPDGGAAKHPLQQYSIGQLQLLGIISGIAEPVALVATPSGDEYVVRTGTPVGTGDGRVVAILPDRVVIVEKYYDYRGQLQTEKYELVLAEEGK